MLSFKIFDLSLKKEQMTRDLRAQLPRRDILAMRGCEACGTMYRLPINRILGSGLVEMIMGNHYVKQRLNLREKKQEKPAIVPDRSLNPHSSRDYDGKIDSSRRKVAPYHHRRTFEGRNLVNPIHPTLRVEAELQGTVTMKGVKDAGKSERLAVMARIESRSQSETKPTSSWCILAEKFPYEASNLQGVTR